MRRLLISLAAILAVAISSAMVYAVRSYEPNRADGVVLALDSEGAEASLTARCAGRRATPDLAAEACTQLIERGGMAPLDAAAVHVNRGNAYLRLSENLRALPDFERAIALNPESTSAFFSRGVAREVFGEHRRALEDFSRVIALAPEHWRAYTRRGLAHQRLGEHLRAIADFDRAVEIGPTEPEPYARRSHSHRALKHYDRAYADAERALAADPGYGFAYRQRALVHLEREEFEQAEADFTRAIERAAGEAELHAERARARQRLEKHALALADLDRAVAIDARNAAYLEARARLYIGFERWREALGDLNGVLALAPNNIDALRLRAQVHEKLGERDEAIADHRALLRVNAYDAGSQAALRRLDADAAEGRTCRDGRAAAIDRIADCTRTINAAATNAEDRAAALLARSQLHASMREPEKALADVEQAMRFKPGWAEAHNQRGVLLLQRGEHRRALADFDRALALDPKLEPNALLNRAHARIALRLYAEALADLERAAGLMPGNAGVFYARGLAHERLGSRDAAVRDYREALKLHPQYQPPREGLKRLRAEM